MRKRSLRGEEAQSPIISTIVMVVIAIVLAAILWAVFQQSPETEEYLCGKKLSEESWYKVILNYGDPSKTLLQEYVEPGDIGSFDPIVQKILFEGAITGVAKLFNLNPLLPGALLVVSIAIYIACEFRDLEGQTYYEDRDAGMDVTILVGLWLDNDDGSVIHPSFEIDLEFTERFAGYEIEDYSLDEGPELLGILPQHFPEELSSLASGRPIPLPPPHG